MGRFGTTSFVSWQFGWSLSGGTLAISSVLCVTASGPLPRGHVSGASARQKGEIGSRDRTRRKAHAVRLRALHKAAAGRSERLDQDALMCICLALIGCLPGRSAATHDLRCGGRALDGMGAGAETRACAVGTPARSTLKALMRRGDQKP